MRGKKDTKPIDRVKIEADVKQSAIKTMDKWTDKELEQYGSLSAYEILNKRRLAAGKPALPVKDGSYQPPKIPVITTIT